MAEQSPELLRDTPTNVVTAQTPTGYLSQGQIEQPFRDASATLGKLADATSDIEVESAKRQAQADLSNQKVIRNPDGSVGVLNPASAMILGDAGKTYARAVQQGTSDQILASVRPDLAALHAANPLDAAGLAKANDSYLDGLGAKMATMGPAGAEVMRSARDAASQHFDAATMAGASNTVDNTKKAILATIDDRKNALSALASTPDGPNKPEYQSALKDYDDALSKLGTNDLFKMPPEYLALQRKEFMGELKGQQLVSQVDRTFDKKGKAEAQSELMQLFQNPDISREQANLLYRQGMAHLEFRSADQTAGQRASDQAIGALQIGLAKGTISPSDPEIAGLRKQAQDAGYADGVNKIDALTKVYSAHKAVSALPAADQPAALGVPPLKVLTGATRNRDGSPPPPIVTGPEEAADHAVGNANIAARTNSDAVANAIHGQESGGRATSVTSVDNAHGGWQVTPGFFKTYAKPGESIDNPADNEAVARRGIADIHQKVGGDPARVAVAYFSGIGNVAPAGSATPFLRDAKDSNGKSTSSYVSDVLGRMGRPTAPTAMSANGVPFSDADAAANPWLRSEYFRSLAESGDVRKDAFTSYVSGSSETLKAGNVLSDDTVTGLAQLSQGDPEKEVKAGELLGMNFALKSMQGGGGGAGPMSEPQIKQAIQDTFNAARAAPDHLHQVMATSAYNYFNEQEKWAQDHPLQDASRRYKQAAPQPIDPNDTAGLPGNIAYRGTLAQHYAQLNGLPAPSIFDKDELPQIKGILANPDPAVKANVYGAIANLPEAVRGATLKEIGGNNPKDMAQAAAGSLMKDAPDVAQSIFRGQGLMETDNRYDPEGEGQQKTTFKGDLDKALPASTFTLQDRSDPTGAYATTSAMVKARYADLSAQAGTTDYSPDRIKQAANDVTGGILSHNGGSLIAPARGMTQTQFDATINGVGDSNLQGAVTLGGQKVTPDYLRNNAQLESVGDGRYFVKLGRDPLKPVYAYQRAEAPPQGDGQWRKFSLDLRNVKPSAAAPAQDAPANWMQ